MSMITVARVWLGAALLVAGGCRASDAPAPSPQRPQSLTIGLGGVSSAEEQLGIRQLVRNQSIEPLVKYDRDGRPIPSLAERWTLSDDGLQLTITLKPAIFQDGSLLVASDVARTLERLLPQSFGPLIGDVTRIEATSDRELVLTFNRRSAFAVEALDLQIAKADAPSVGTGPFSQRETTGERETAGEVVELVANDRYHLGKPALNRIVLKPYPSVRAAWADLLRGQVDMLYEVGVDAMDSLEPSSRVKVHTFRRPYETIAVFNMRRAALKDAALRRALNLSVDRERLVDDALGGFGRPAWGPVWPDHWAHGDVSGAPRYAPRRLVAGRGRLKLNCIFPTALSERLALIVARELQSVGVDLTLESLPLDEFARRIEAADYDMLLTEAIAGPSLIRPYLFWHSKGPYNYGGFNSPEVDAALDRIRHAENDAEYRAGVAAFQEAVAHDPPAIFLAWNERARAVSTAFDVPAEPGRDILSSIHLWRPAGRPPAQALN